MRILQNRYVTILWLALAAAGLGQWAAGLPNGLATPAGWRGTFYRGVRIPLIADTHSKLIADSIPGDRGHPGWGA